MLTSIAVNATRACGRMSNGRQTLVVDPAAFGVGDPARNFLGLGDASRSHRRMLHALGLNGSGSKQQRYLPDHPAGESCSFGLDFSALVPFGAALKSGTLDIQTNTATPTEAGSDWTIGPVEVRGRRLSAILSGGVPGTDYRLVWTATDTAGNVWPRLALCLCADTS